MLKYEEFRGVEVMLENLQNTFTILLEAQRFEYDPPAGYISSEWELKANIERVNWTLRFLFDLDEERFLVDCSSEKMTGKIKWKIEFDEIRKHAYRQEVKTLAIKLGNYRDKVITKLTEVSQ